MITELSYPTDLPGSVLYEVWRGQPPHGCYGDDQEIVQVRTVTEKDCETLGICYFDGISPIGVWMRIDGTSNEIQWAKFYNSQQDCRNAFEGQYGDDALSNSGSNVSTMLDQYQLDDLKNAIQFGPQTATLSMIQTEMQNMGLSQSRVLEAIKELVRARDKQENISSVKTLLSRPKLGKALFSHTEVDSAGGAHEIVEWKLNKQGIVALEGRKTIVTWTRFKPAEGKKKGLGEFDFSYCYETLAAAFANHKGYRPPTNTSEAGGAGGTVTIRAGDSTSAHSSSTSKDKNMDTSDTSNIGYETDDKTKNVAGHAFKRGATVALATQFVSVDLANLLLSRAKEHGLDAEIADHPVARKTVEALLPFLMHIGVSHFEGVPKRDFFLTASALAMEGTSKDSMQPLIGFMTKFLTEAIGLAKTNGLAQVIDIETGKAKGAETDGDAAATGTDG